MTNLNCYDLELNKIAALDISENFIGNIINILQERKGIAEMLLQADLKDGEREGAFTYLRIQNTVIKELLGIDII